jgi:hypothetical protein
VVVKRLSDAVPALLASPSPPEIKPQIWHFDVSLRWNIFLVGSDVPVNSEAPVVTLLILRSASLVSCRCS